MEVFRQNDLTHLAKVFSQVTDPRSKHGTYEDGEVLPRLNVFVPQIKVVLME